MSTRSGSAPSLGEHTVIKILQTEIKELTKKNNHQLEIITTQTAKIEALSRDNRRLQSRRNSEVHNTDKKVHKAKEQTKEKCSGRVAVWKDKYKGERDAREDEVKKREDQMEEERKKNKEDVDVLQAQLKEKEKEKEKFTAQVTSLSAQVELWENNATKTKDELANVRIKTKDMLTELKEEGRLLPEFKDTTSTSEDSMRRTASRRASSLLSALDYVGPDVLVDAVMEKSKQQKKDGKDTTYFDDIWKSTPFDNRRKRSITDAINVVSETWDESMEADIKLITNVSDVHLDFMRNYRSKHYKVDTDAHFMRTVEEGLSFPISTSRWKRNKEIKRRAEELGLEHNADGTIATLDLASAITRVHRHMSKKTTHCGRQACTN